MLYEELLHQMKSAPQSWLPALLRELVSFSIQRGVVTDVYTLLEDIVDVGDAGPTLPVGTPDTPDLCAMMCELLQDARAANPAQLQQLLLYSVPVGADGGCISALTLLTALARRWCAAQQQPTAVPSVVMDDETGQVTGFRPYVFVERCPQAEHAPGLSDGTGVPLAISPCTELPPHPPNVV